MSLVTCTVEFKTSICFRSLRTGLCLPLGHHYNVRDEILFKTCISAKELEMQAVDLVIWNSLLVLSLRCRL